MQDHPGLAYSRGAARTLQSGNTFFPAVVHRQTTAPSSLGLHHPAMALAPFWVQFKESTNTQMWKLQCSVIIFFAHCTLFHFSQTILSFKRILLLASNIRTHLSLKNLMCSMSCHSNKHLFTQATFIIPSVSRREFSLFSFIRICLLWQMHVQQIGSYCNPERTANPFVFQI